jgi:hypothetical protein
MMLAAGLLIAMHAKDKHKAELIKKLRAQLQETSKYLGNYSASPPVFTTDKADSMYVLRGETDIYMVEIAVKQYELGRVGEDVVERAVDRLDRDIEDIPPSQADDPVPHGRRI